MKQEHFDKTNQTSTFIIENNVEEQLLKRNQAALIDKPGMTRPAKGDGTGQDTVKPRNGICRKWQKEGKCAAGKGCPWAASHTDENKPKPREMSKGRGKSRDKSPNRQSGRSPTPKPGNREQSPARKRGKSPSGEPDKPPCIRYLKGNCTNANCKYLHPPECRNLKKKGECPRGSKCEYLHVKPKAAAKAKAKAAAAAAAAAAPGDKDKDKPQGRVARFSFKEEPSCGSGQP